MPPAAPTSSAPAPAEVPPAAPIEELLADLSRPEAWPRPAPGGVEVIQTHCSAVFLVGDRAYKLKKALDLGFLDFSTRALRLAACRAEVELNRRLAPEVYLGVAPIVRGPDGRLRALDGEAPAGTPVVEWAVAMVRLPEDHTLAARLAAGQVGPADLRALGARLAAFHAAAGRGPEVGRWARLEVVAANCRQNFEQSRGLVGVAVTPRVLAALEARTEAELARWGPRIEERALGGVARDTHGDLRLDHVYLFPGRAPPGDVVVVDCIEFSARYRHADPVADVAFLAMDLRMRGAWDLAEALLEAYFRASGDDAGRALLPLYCSYRSVVRAKVAGFQLAEAEIAPEARRRALERARGHFLLGLSELAPPAERPGLVLVTGLPGTGKSTIARRLHERLGFAWVRSDEVRKGLAGLDPLTRGGPDLYTAAHSERTYDRCLELAALRLRDGERVVVDATFREDRRRAQLLDAARGLGVRAVILLCEADPAIVRARLAARVGDASDADWAVHEALRARWEPPGPAVAPRVRRLDLGGDVEAAWAAARAALVEAGLADPAGGVTALVGARP